ncbi:DEAD/DEAH box helicase [Candidatus Dojkabacteria bacterium]|uniref:DEAD/DEAH box helicase n=1 Tax=Candidatus Dojkabacteria bacterium TaxID=2099670 RepID=A0A955L1N5_9BACT|nr:DEAD/DEAH box helicase [Candidatus Dojkabacteria bacterium]
MTVIEDLEKSILEDDYFKELSLKVEKFAAYKFFQNTNAITPLTEKEFLDLMKYADLLSHSENPLIRNTSYRIVSLLADQDEYKDIYNVFSIAILSKLGNFPALTLLKQEDKVIRLPLDRELEKNDKEVIQQIPNSDKIFTTAQYEVFESLKSNNHFSFSGPTSLGKSFIIKHFISYLIDKDDSCGNIAILVPTRALITQVTQEVKHEYLRHQDYTIVNYPTLSPIIRKTKKKFIFVFTPERLLAYFSENENPKIDYLFIDEAHKILSSNDTRSPLYYHSIIQAQRKSVRLFFASPNVPNPEVFLELFQLSTDEKLNIKESPVSQNLYYADLIEKKAFLIYDKEEIEIDIVDLNINEFIKALGQNQKSIVYCNTPNDTIFYAREFAASLPDIPEDPEIKKLITLIKEQLHKDYYLINCLKKGVAFHFGRLPQNIRERVEKLFAERSINYVFCTSTLLEGVNLPAKNIFILSNAISTKKFTDIDFWNLAGRAGRLTKELSGNIICVRAENKKNRWDQISDRSLLKNKQISKKVAPIDKTKRSIFQNMEYIIKDEDKFTKKTPTSNEVETWRHYANIALIHEKTNVASTLRENFILSNAEEHRKLLAKASNEITVPKEVLIKSSAINPRYQNNIYNEYNLEPLPQNINRDTIHHFLQKFYNYYQWSKIESLGISPMIPKEDKILNKYALLMEKWMNSAPLSQIIWESINWYSDGPKQIWNNRTRTYEVFGTYQLEHINIIVNDVINLIENVFRFKMERYFQNYYDLLKAKLGSQNAGTNWAEFLEYGTTNKRIIDLQNFGFPRHLAKHIIEKYSSILVFENNQLISIDLNKLKDESGKSTEVLDQELTEYI